MLTYTVISDWANDVFSLNPQTGVFTLTARLDYEEVSNTQRNRFFIKEKKFYEADNHSIEREFSDETMRKIVETLIFPF